MASMQGKSDWHCRITKQPITYVWRVFWILSGSECEGE